MVRRRGEGAGVGIGWVVGVLWAIQLAVAAASASSLGYLAFGEVADGEADFVEIPDADDLDLAGPAFTLAAWIRPKDWGQNNQGRILAHGGASGASGWTLHLENKRKRGFPQALRMQINDDGSVEPMSDPDAIALDVWQHVAVTFADGTLRFFVDGFSVGVRTGVPAPLPDSSTVVIGARNDAMRAFEGDIDDVQIWSRVLSESEILSFMNDPPTGDELGLVAFFPFDEGSGQFALDASLNAHDGVLGSTVEPDAHDPTWLSSLPPSNAAPSVDAGPDRVAMLTDGPAALDGTVSDDGLPVGSLTTLWEVVSGPPGASFGDEEEVDTTVDFAAPGDYVLRLTANDTELAASDEVSITVEALAVLEAIQVTPNVATLGIGEVQAFQAEGVDQVGNPMQVNPAWSATGGTIDASGVYVAGSTLGSFSVTATDSGVSGQASVSISDASDVWPTGGWETATPAEVGLDEQLLAQARDYALSEGGAGFITRDGKLVMSWGNSTRRYGMKSVTKSMGSLALGLAVGDGLLALDDLVQWRLPRIGIPPDSNAETGWLEQMTILHLATHTAGFKKSGGYTSLIFRPGTAWGYADGGANWLADVLTSLYGEDLLALLTDRVLSVLGIPESEVRWRENNYRETTIDGVTRREFGSGMSLSVDAMARIGYLMLRDGVWDGQRLLPEGFVDAVRTTVPGVVGLPVTNDTKDRFGGASDHYGILWWNNADGSLANVPRDAFWAWGLGDKLILVIPSLDIVASRAGSEWSGNRSPSFYPALEPFIEPIARAAE